MVPVVPQEMLDKVFNSLNHLSVIADARIFIDAGLRVLDSWRKGWYERRDSEALAFIMEDLRHEQDRHGLVYDQEFSSSVGYERAHDAFGPFGSSVYKCRAEQYRCLAHSRQLQRGENGPINVAIVNLFQNAGIRVILA